MSQQRRKIRPEPLSEAAWAPFGWLPVSDTDPRDGEHRLTFTWDDAHVNLIGHSRDEVPANDDGLRCEMLFRHDTHTQTVMSLDVPAVIAVAPGSAAFTGPGDAEAIRVFRLEPLEPLVLHRGTWHWGPFPVSAAQVRLFNVQGRRYADDNACVDLAGQGADVDVVLAVMDIDESEFMAGTLPELVRAVTARDEEPGPDGRLTYATTSPNWWGGDRTFGGMVVAQALSAASRTVPDELEVHSLHGYFLRPSPSGSTSLHRVERVRDGRSFSVREVRSEVEGRATFRMTCSFHVPEAGDDYQLPMATGIPPPDDIGGVEMPLPFDIRELGRRPGGRTGPTRRPAAAGSAPANGCRTTRPCTRACWPISQI